MRRIPRSAVRAAVRRMVADRMATCGVTRSEALRSLVRGYAYDPDADPQLVEVARDMLREHQAPRFVWRRGDVLFPDQGGHDGD